MSKRQHTPRNTTYKRVKYLTRPQISLGSCLKKSTSVFREYSSKGTKRHRLPPNNWSGPRYTTIPTSNKRKKNSTPNTPAVQRVPAAPTMIERSVDSDLLALYIGRARNMETSSGMFPSSSCIPPHRAVSDRCGADQTRPIKVVAYALIRCCLREAAFREARSS